MVVENAHSNSPCMVEANTPVFLQVVRDLKAVDQ